MSHTTSYLRFCHQNTHEFVENQRDIQLHTFTNGYKWFIPKFMISSLDCRCAIGLGWRQECT